MRVLFVVPYTPNLVRVRSLQLISHLARQGHDLTVATLWSSAAEQDDLLRLERSGVRVLARRLSRPRSARNVLRVALSAAPLQAAYCWHPGLAADLVASAADGRGCDVIHVEHLRGARYGLWLREHLRPARGHSRPPLVWDSVDCISHLFAQAAQKSRSLKGRWMTRLELGRTQRYEGWLAGQFDQVTVTSPIDAQALEALWRIYGAQAGRQSDATPRLRSLHVLPNGVDLDYFAPGEEPRDPSTIVFSGKMSYHANISAALYLVNDVMPHVWAANATAQVIIVGKDPSQQVMQLAQQHPGRVVVTGGVPDIRPYLRRATVAVAPMLYSAGIQNKVLEAMACATPVVATAQAISALSARPGLELAAANDASGLAVEILALLSNPVRQAELGRAGRSYVEHGHSWPAAAAQLAAIYHAALEGPRRASAGVLAQPGVRRHQPARQPAGRL